MPVGAPEAAERVSSPRNRILGRFGPFELLPVLGHFSPPINPWCPLVPPHLPYLWPEISLKFAISRQICRKIAFLMVGNHFYSLGELQLWVFRRIWPSNGGGRAFLRYFGRILAPQRAKSGYIRPGLTLCRV